MQGDIREYKNIEGYWAPYQIASLTVWDFADCECTRILSLMTNRFFLSSVSEPICRRTWEKITSHEVFNCVALVSVILARISATSGGDGVEFTAVTLAETLGARVCVRISSACFCCA